RKRLAHRGPGTVAGSDKIILDTTEVDRPDAAKGCAQHPVHKPGEAVQAGDGLVDQVLNGLDRRIGGMDEYLTNRGRQGLESSNDGAGDCHHDADDEISVRLRRILDKAEGDTRLVGKPFIGGAELIDEKRTDAVIGAKRHVSEGQGDLAGLV